MVELMCMPYRRQAILESIIYKLCYELEFINSPQISFNTAYFLIKFILLLDVKLPGDAHTVSNGFAFDCFKGILEFSILIFAKTAYKYLSQIKEKEKIEEIVIENIRKWLFEMSEDWQINSLQVTGLLLLAEYASGFKKLKNLCELSKKYYADYTRPSKFYQNFIEIYNMVPCINEEFLEKEAISALKFIDNILLEKYKQDDFEIIKRKLSKIEKLRENTSNLICWSKILFDVGEFINTEISASRKKRKSKFCSLVIKHYGTEQHRILMEHLKFRLSNLDYLYFGVISLMSVQKYRKAILLAEVFFITKQ